MSRIVGIDLGTTNSAIAYLSGGKPDVIQTSVQGENLVRSVVAFDKDSGERMVGGIAKRQRLANPKNTVASIKRLIGRKYKDPEISRISDLLSIELAESPNGDVVVRLNGSEYSPPEISAMILQQLKSNAEEYFGEEVSQAVITVPAYFDSVQRQATIDAGRIAGLKVLRIINEPTAASLAYGLGEGKEGTVAVFDIGGGTFDISIVDISDGVFDVKATQGDTYLGGDNFDEAIIMWIVDEFKAEEGIDLRGNLDAMTRLTEAAEVAKIDLSSQFNTTISIPFIVVDAGGPKHLEKPLTRAKFENLTEELVRQTVMPCQQALEDAGLTADDIDEVLLVGGMTRMPAIQDVAKEIFGKEPARNINPDEAVAMGAAIQSGILDGVVKDIVLLDVTPLTLGTEVKGGISDPIITRNTTIPTRKSKNYTTTIDNQTGIRVSVVQGERHMAANNTLLGEFDLDDIPPAPRGKPHIEITFEIDANGVLHVAAKDLATGNKQGITVLPSSGLREDQIKEAIDEATRFAEEDQQRKEMAEAKNLAEQTIYRAEKLIRDHKRKFGEEAVRFTEERIDDLKELLTSDDTDTIRSATDALLEQTHKLSRQLYVN